ncbi:MAG: biopolymer transporter ExbD [Nitrospirae bacterium]|nr:biopolymer transporter ExbD [Nitrospirota bacterium]
MKIPRASAKKARIEIIPMIDTMFFLLVFFMIATLSMTLQRGMPVNLPQANTATDNIPEEASLTLTTQGELFFNKDLIGLAELESSLANLLQTSEEPLVIINADEAVTHGRVIEVMDTVRKTGITNMAIATKPETES